MKKFIYIPLFLILAFIGYTFHGKNPQVVELNYLGFYWQGSLSVLLIASILLGVVLGSLAMAIYSIKAKAQTRGIRKKLAKVEKEVENLRTLPIKDDI